MNTQLMNDTFTLLQLESSPIANISFHIEQGELLQLEGLLHRYNLSDHRKLHLSSLYTVLSLAFSRHQHCQEDDPELTRKVLDGDYLYSLYVQLAIKFEEMELLKQLAPVIKRWQIRRAANKAVEETLYQAFERFLELEYSIQQRQAMIGQVS